MLSVENLNGELTDDQLEKIVKESLKDFSSVKKVLLIHPDYTRIDFTNKIVPLIYQELKNRGMKQIDFLNAGGTHRAMSAEEIRCKLGLSSQFIFTNFFNHEYNNP